MRFSNTTEEVLITQEKRLNFKNFYTEIKNADEKIFTTTT